MSLPESVSFISRDRQGAVIIFETLDAKRLPFVEDYSCRSTAASVRAAVVSRQASLLPRLPHQRSPVAAIEPEVTPCAAIVLGYVHHPCCPPKSRSPQRAPGDHATSYVRPSARHGPLMPVLIFSSSTRPGAPVSCTWLILVHAHLLWYREAAAHLAAICMRDSSVLSASRSTNLPSRKRPCWACSLHSFPQRKGHVRQALVLCVGPPHCHAIVNPARRDQKSPLLRQQCEVYAVPPAC